MVYVKPIHWINHIGLYMFIHNTYQYILVGVYLGGPLSKLLCRPKRLRVRKRKMTRWHCLALDSLDSRWNPAAKPQKCFWMIFWVGKLHTFAVSCWIFMDFLGTWIPLLKNGSILAILGSTWRYTGYPMPTKKWDKYPLVNKYNYGKSAIYKWVIFDNYVKLPEGNSKRYNWHVGLVEANQCDKDW